MIRIRPPPRRGSAQNPWPQPRADARVAYSPARADHPDPAGSASAARRSGATASAGRPATQGSHAGVEVPGRAGHVRPVRRLTGQEPHGRPLVLPGRPAVHPAQRLGGGQHGVGGQRVAQRGGNAGGQQQPGGRPAAHRRGHPLPQGVETGRPLGSGRVCRPANRADGSLTRCGKQPAASGTAASAAGGGEGGPLGRAANPSTLSPTAASGATASARSGRRSAGTRREPRTARPLTRRRRRGWSPACQVAGGQVAERRRHGPDS